MICPKCGANNDDLQTVCFSCGEPLTPGFLMCPVCGKVLKEGQKVCPRCNSVVDEKIIMNNKKEEKVAFTPKYVVKAPLSLPSILSIMVFMGYSLVYNIIMISIRIGTDYSEYSTAKIIGLFFSTEIRPLVLLMLFIISIITFIKRVSINRLTTIEELNKRLVTLKCLLLADVVAFFTYFMVSYWPYMFNNMSNLHLTGGILGLLALIVSLLSLPLFYKKARVRTR